jgi:ParB-like chromosome segregation protein Spo0J
MIATTGNREKETDKMSAVEGRIAPGDPLNFQKRKLAPRMVKVSSLIVSASLRLNGENREHVLRLLEVQPSFLPPILVHSATMKVIDGVHRVRAAILRKQEYIEARIFEGSEEDAYLWAIMENTRHGLPLTLTERRMAAARILVTHPHLSNRMVGALVGLSHNTVAVIRRSSGQNAQLSVRVGADGRLRPMASKDGRRRASELIAARPEASLREIATEVGISVGTAHDVRRRMRRGEDPVNIGRAESGPPEGSVRGSRQPGSRGDQMAAEPARVPVGEILQRLANDPALRHSDRGKDLLRWLHAHAIGVEEWQRLSDVIPAYRMGSVAQIAQQCAQAWQRFADELARREGNTAGSDARHLPRYLLCSARTDARTRFLR